MKFEMSELSRKLLAMNDGDEHEVPRPKLVRTGCRLF